MKRSAGLNDGARASLASRASGTDVVHAGSTRNEAHALAPPIVQSATFTFASTAELAAYKAGEGETRDEYGRYGNPTVRALESRLAALEGTEDGAAFASGMAAITTTLFALLRAGDHLVVFQDAYRQTRRFAAKTLARYGVTCTFVPAGAAGVEALEGALRSETKVVFFESPSNPYGHVVDVVRLAAILRGRRIRSVIDATFATPALFRPALLGADLVIHSATKYLAGHNDVLGGAVLGPSHLVGLVREMRDVLGGVLDPHAAFLVARGLKTLSLRVERQSETALRLARELSAHPAVERVFYPGLPSHPDHDAATRQMAGYGGVVSFTLRGGEEAARALCDRVKIPLLAPSLGGTESLIEPVVLMSYAGSSPEELEAAGIEPGLVRLAVGIEDPEDLLADVLQALA